MMHEIENLKLVIESDRMKVADGDYHHHILCSALHNTPLGSVGCICEVVIKGSYEREIAAARARAIEECAILMDLTAKRWISSFPIDEVQSLNCKQYAKAIRALASPVEEKL